MEVQSLKSDIDVTSFDVDCDILNEQEVFQNTISISEKKISDSYVLHLDGTK